MAFDRSSESLISRVSSRGRLAFTAALERIYLPLDRSLARRTLISQSIPRLGDRRGGKVSYSDWCWLIGILQSELHHLTHPDDAPFVVDLGCGTGLGAIAATSVVGPNARYLGLDIREEDVKFCTKHYSFPTHRFAVLEQRNDFYRDTGEDVVTWPIPDASADIVMAVSVWSHLQEDAARAAFKEAARVLNPGGHLLFTGFIQGEESEGPHDLPARSRFHNTSPRRWNFSESLGNGWHTTKWAEPPEAAIAISQEALDSALADAGLNAARVVHGTWRERPGLFFQDIIIATPQPRN